MVLTGVIILVIWAITRSSRNNSGTLKSYPALDIAKERYARGEITKTEFEQIKKDLFG
jgi:putative membrane protein